MSLLDRLVLREILVPLGVGLLAILQLLVILQLLQLNEVVFGSAVSLRMELRGYGTAINSSGGFFCSGGCVVVLRGDALVQAEAIVGLSMRF